MGFAIDKGEAGNVITHLISVILSLIWLGSLIVLAWNDTANIFWGCVLYCLMLTLTFSASVVYHATSHPPLKRMLRVADHIAIFVLIAVTHTTTMLVIPGVTFKPWLFLYIWIGVAAGILLHYRLWIDAWDWSCEFLSLCLYIFLGLLGFPVVGWDNLLNPQWPITLLFVGGATYLLGVVFYGLEGRKVFRYGHEVWHVISTLGAAFHTLAHGVVAYMQ